MESIVSKWVDYTTKYGLGYIMSDGTAGAVYNDYTRVAIDKTNQ